MVELDLGLELVAKEFPTGKPNISYSEVKNWLECTYRHKLAYIDGKSIFENSIYTIFGTAIHSACENFLKTREMDAHIATSFILENWKKYKFEDVKVWTEKARRILEDIPTFMETTFPGWEYVCAEERLYESIDNQKIKFKGFIDGIIKVKKSSGKDIFWILDWKTASWGWSSHKKQDILVTSQIVLYKTFWSRKHNISMSDIRAGFVLLKRDEKPGKSCELLTVSVGPTTARKSLKIVDNMIKSVKKGILIKNRYSCKYCEFYETPDCT